MATRVGKKNEAKVYPELSDGVGGGGGSAGGVTPVGPEGEREEARIRPKGARQKEGDNTVGGEDKEEADKMEERDDKGVGGKDAGGHKHEKEQDGAGVPAHPKEVGHQKTRSPELPNDAAVNGARVLRGVPGANREGAVSGMSPLRRGTRLGGPHGNVRHGGRRGRS